jgi:hypothetical protein
VAVAPFGANNSFNVDRLLIKLSNVVQFVKFVGGSQPARSSELNSCDRDYTAPPADTRRVPPSPSRAPADCACTFYLVFKEPGSCLAHRSALRRDGWPERSPSTISLSGEPSNLTNRGRPCQPLCRNFFRSAVQRRAAVPGGLCADWDGVANPKVFKSGKKNLLRRCYQEQIIPATRPGHAR